MELPHPSHPSEVRRASILPFALLAGFLVVAALVQATPTEAHLFGIAGPDCPSKWIAPSHGCPGCGLTRGTALVMDGAFSEAHRVHGAAGLVVALAALGALLHGSILITGKKPAWTDRLFRSGRFLMCAGLLAAWWLRWA